MNFFQLECFTAAVEKGSFAEVAGAMHVTQPTITYQITNLEEELGEQLFLRTRRGVEITRAGLLFYDSAKSILREYRQALDRFKHAVTPADSVIRVGFTRPPDNYDFYTAIQRFRARRPDTVVDVVLDEAVMSGELEQLENHFDVLIHYRYSEDDFPDYEYVPLGSCPFYVLVSQYSPLAEKEALTLDDLRGHRQLVMERYKNGRQQVPSLRELKKAGIEISVVDDMEQLMYAIADGAGYGVYPSKYQDVKTGFKCVPFLFRKPLEYGLLYHREHSAIIEDFLRFLQAELKDVPVAVPPLIGAASC